MKSLGNFPDPFIAEINGQPDALRRGAVAVMEQSGALEEIGRRAAGRTLVFTGMGSSYDACYPAVTELARAGVAAVMLDSAELVHFRSGMLGPDAVVTAVSQSGESAEIVRLIREVRGHRDRPLLVGVANGLENTLARLSDISLDTRAGDETGPSTMTFAGSLVAVAAVGRAMAGRPVQPMVEQLGIEAELAAVSIEGMLADLAMPDRLADWLGARDTVVILGRGPARAAAEMGALTLKEAVGMAVESLETAQFRHGPLELAGPPLAAMVIATEPETAALDVGLADELSAAGAAVLLVTEREHPSDAAITLVTGPLDRALAPAASILPAQLLAWRLSVLRGRDPGAYYRASKVTTRE